MGEGCERRGRVVSGGSIESSKVLVARGRCPFSKQVLSSARFLVCS